MDNEQAKLILGCYRAGGEDASDPFFAEALEQARVDPELGRWFEEQIRFDERFISAVRTDLPPDGLREQLLLANKVVTMQGDDRNREGRAFWGIPSLWISIAAIVVVGFGYLFLRPDQDRGLASREKIVANLIEKATTGDITLGKMTGDTVALRAWLGEQGTPSDFAIPEKLEHLNGIGCQSYLIEGGKVSLICFSIGKDQVVHLFVIDEGEQYESLVGTSMILHEGSAPAAAWSDAGKTFLLTGTNVDADTIKSLL